MIDGRFELLARLGGGGMGLVWRARDLVLHREVAVKEVRPSDPGLVEYDPAAADALRSRVLREARALARISHPNVVTIHHIVDGSEYPFPWLVMELVTGGSLHDRLADGPLGPAEAADLGRGVLAGLCAAHAADIQHRDIKPANILLRPDGRPLLTDFGIAAVQGSTALTAVGALIGTPDYMAPERVAGGEGGPAADLWSLALTLYVAVEGRNPLRRGNTLATLAAVLGEDVPPPRNAGPLTEALTAVLVRDPSSRPDAEALDLLLARAAGAPGPGAVAPGAPAGKAPSPGAAAPGPPGGSEPGPGAVVPGQPAGNTPGGGAPPRGAPGAAASGPPTAAGPGPGSAPRAAPAPVAPGFGPAPGMPGVPAGTPSGLATPSGTGSRSGPGFPSGTGFPSGPGTPPPGGRPGPAPDGPVAGPAPTGPAPSAAAGFPGAGAPPAVAPAPVSVPLPYPAPEALRRPPAPARRRRVWLSAAALGAVALAGTLVWSLLPSGSDPSGSDPGGKGRADQGRESPAGTEGTDTGGGKGDGPEQPGGKKITIGVKADQPGLSVKGTDGSYAGFEVDTATYVAESLGYRPENIEWRPVTSAQRETMLQNGTVDFLVATYTITQDRTRRVDFAGPYLVAHQDVLLRADDTAVRSAADLNGRKVCSVLGSTPARNLKATVAPEAELQELSSLNSCLTELRNGAVDAVTTDDAILAGLAARERGTFRLGGFGLSEERYAIGVRKGSPLKKKISDALEKMVRDGSWERALRKNLPGLDAEAPTVS
ncbi:transporter substrate-binding domain-containing protein [Streptomyces pactum]|uniref:bifunctional serine/threonine-protein kinase/glutamate ABC transporter substrate-binding protein n=1 Tax=Streptomyces pactum TaxID=68249 RepID=UPI0027DB2743|nr:transporter substrate-binding domain-containing protein [Streptomyces pactum]